MRHRIRKTIGFLLFLAILTILQSFHSKALSRVSAYLVLGLILISSCMVVFRTLTNHRQDSYGRIGWGNPLSTLPASWQRWLLDEKRGRAD